MPIRRSEEEFDNMYTNLVDIYDEETEFIGESEDEDEDEDYEETETFSDFE